MIISSKYLEGCREADQQLATGGIYDIDNVLYLFSIDPPDNDFQRGMHDRLKQRKAKGDHVPATRQPSPVKYSQAFIDECIDRAMHRICAGPAEDNPFHGTPAGKILCRPSTPKPSA